MIDARPFQEASMPAPNAVPIHVAVKGDEPSRLILIPSDGFGAIPVCIVRLCRDESQRRSWHVADPDRAGFTEAELADALCAYMAGELAARQRAAAEAKLGPADLNPPPPRAEVPFESDVE